MMKNPDVIVAGLGAMGSAALYQLAVSGVSVLGLDRFEPPHDRGSTHGETRITRSAIGEGEEFVPLVLRSNDIWEELSERTGRRLLNRTGLLIFTDGGGGSVLHGKDILGETIRIAGKFSIPHEVLDGNALRERFPSLSYGPGASGYFEPGAGYLVPELCVSTNLEEARRLGARVNVNEAVLAVTSSEGGVKVTTFALLGFVIWAELRGEPTVHVLRRRLPQDVQRQALTIALLAVAAVISSTAVLLELSAHTLDEVFFEAISAFATVGLSTGITADLPDLAHLILVSLMFFGRLGPLTLGAALALRSRPRRYDYPEERAIVG